MKRIILLLLTINGTVLYAQEEYPAKSYLHFNYNVIDSNAVANGSLVYDDDSLLHDGDMGISPYLNQQITGSLFIF